ncbi:MAG TPA: hypothetical protein VHC67_13280 [Gaiellaceae bacterium]|jgi:hypothetical protein|nr:hypothetical protein [Gaiellaceae bacterium]
MKRLLLVLVAAALVAPGAARSAACTPLNCAPSEFSVPGTSLVGYRAQALARITVADLRTGATRFVLPGGYVDGHRLVHQAGRTLAWYDLRTGRRTSSVRLPFALRLSGASSGGGRAVGFFGSTVVIVGSGGTVRKIQLAPGNWDFDALRGSNLFLIRYVQNGGYQVRVVDVSSDSPASRVIKDPRESATIWGSPASRLASRDGRYLFTLYTAANGASMVHELDLVHATARCIDLPGTGDYNSALSWSLALSPDGRTLWAAGAGYSRLVGIDVRTREVVAAHGLDLPYWNLVNATRSAVSPDGRELALTDGETVARVRLTDGTLVERAKVKARAVGYASSGALRMLK